MVLVVVCMFLAIGHISVTAGGHTANQKLRNCCILQRDADRECKQRFCNFDRITQQNVGRNIISPIRLVTSVLSRHLLE